MGDVMVTRGSPKPPSKSSILLSPAMKLSHLFWLCIFLKLLDFITTYECLTLSGTVDNEANPLPRWLMEQIGLVPALLVGSALAAVILTFLFWACRKLDVKWPFYLLNAVMFGVVINNCYWWWFLS